MRLLKSRVGRLTAELLYLHAGQINFKVPQESPVAGATEVPVFYRGRSGPAVKVDLASAPHTRPAQQLAENIWSGLQKVAWDTPYRESARGSTSSCSAVPAHQALRGGLYGYACYWSQPAADLVLESFYYPADGAPPQILLRRADFRLAAAYPLMLISRPG